MLTVFTGDLVLQRSTEVNGGKIMSMAFADFMSFFRDLLLSKAMLGADFNQTFILH